MTNAEAQRREDQREKDNAPANRAALPFHRKLNTDEAADLIGFASQTLRGFRSKGVGPRSMKVGGKVLYDPDDLMAWVNEEAAKAEAAQRQAKATQLAAKAKLQSDQPQ